MPTKKFSGNRGDNKPKFGLRSVPKELYRVPGEGPMPAEIMLIGERPGKNEAERGKPFVGTAGRILDICLNNAGLNRNQIYITNLVKDYKDYDKPTAEEISRDRDELWAEILCVNPRVIGCLGTFATEWILGWDRANLDRTHGVPVWHQLEGLPDRSIVVPCYHPASGIYSSDNLALTGSDLIAVSMCVDGSLSPLEDIFGDPDYRADDSPNSGIGECAVDTEGSRRNPWCLTWSAHPGRARLIHPGHSPQFLRKIFLHNSLHDLSVLRSMGINIEDGQFVDTMVLAYLLCLEPQGLKELAYRHAGMSMSSYQEIIAEADYSLAMEYLLTVEAYGEEYWPAAESYCVIEGGVAKIYNPQPIYRRVTNILRDVRSGKVNKNGDKTDPRDRWHKIDDWLKSSVEKDLGPMPEPTLDDVPYEVAVNYACRDADATYRIAPILQAKISEMGLDRVAEIDHGIIPMIDRMQENGIKLADKVEWDKLELKCDAQMGKGKFAIFQLTGAEINPDSGDQVAALLYDQLGIKPPWYTEGGKDGSKSRGSTIDKALESITTHRDIIDAVLDYREASKVVTSFINPLRRIAISDNGDGRVHCNFRITRVSSGRLAATKPNLLAIPVRTSLGKEIRERFIAEDDHVLGDWDLDQIEMRWMAHLSRDKKLCQIFIDGKVDVHRQTASWTFGVPYNSVLPEQRYAAKRVGFGVITGITEYGLLDQMNLARARRPDGNPWTLDDCGIMIAEWFKIYSGVQLFMQEAANETHNTGMSRDYWGRIRYLPAIWSPIPAINAEAARQASSHKIQAGAQGLMKLAMAEIWKHVCKTGYMEPLLQVHDSIMGEVVDDPEIREFVAENVVYHLTQTTKLSVPIKAKGSYGKNWAECKD